MNPILAGGLFIGLGCAAWTFVMGFSGWYKDPAIALYAFLPGVILIEVAGLLWGLRRTAAQGRTYSGQVVAGTLMAIIAGAIIICSSLIFTTLVFPEYFSELNAASREMMLKEGRSEGEIAELIEATAPMQTPMANAMSGFLGTFVTGVIVSAIASLWIRARPTGRL